MAAVFIVIIIIQILKKTLNTFEDDWANLSFSEDRHVEHQGCIGCDFDAQIRHQGCVRPHSGYKLSIFMDLKKKK